VPRFADHDQRRAEVITAATAVVRDEGRSALTVRRVAQSVGCSTKVVTHYFASMSDLLHATWLASLQRATKRFVDVLKADPADLRGFMSAGLPLDEERRLDWSIWIAFWTEAHTSEQFGQDLRTRSVGTYDRLVEILTTVAARGDLPQGLDIPTTALRLNALLTGIACQAMFNPQLWTPEQQLTVLDGELAAIGIR
jgi:hypothetical protein